MRLANWLSALSNATSLSVLRELRTAKRAAEIRVRSQGAGDARLLSRQSIHHHLDKLVEAGFATTEEVDVSGRERRIYSLNAGLLFSAAEDLRRLATVNPLSPSRDQDATLTVSSITRARRADGPHLALVHGVKEGLVYPLDAASLVDDSWVIGRGKDAAITISDDPSVSRHHAAISRDAKGTYHLRDLPRSKNGTLLNWAPLDTASEPLKPGDIIMIGNAKLVFRSG